MSAYGAGPDAAMWARYLGKAERHTMIELMLDSLYGTADPNGPWVRVGDDFPKDVRKAAGLHHKRCYMLGRQPFMFYLDLEQHP